MAPDWDHGGAAGRPGRRPGVTAVLVVVVVVAVAVLARPGSRTTGDGDGLEILQAQPSEPPAARRPPDVRSAPATPPAPTPTPEVSGALAGRWRSSPAPEEAGGVEPALAWDGARRLLLHGGQRWLPEGHRSAFQGGTWLYDIGVDAWRPLPPAPLEPRSGAAAAWTGEEFVVWGGVGPTQHFTDGAAYDPVGDSWRLLPAGPLSGRRGATAVALADGTLLIVGGADNAGGLVDAARLDPATGSWSEAPAMPAAAPVLAGGSVLGASVGDLALIWPREQWGPEPVPPLRYAGDAWSPTVLPGPPQAAFAVQPLADGRLFGVHARQVRSGRHTAGELVALGPGEERWEALAEVPLAGLDGATIATIAGRLLVVLDLRGRGVAYDPAEDRWRQLPVLGRRGSDPWAAHTHPTADGFILVEPDPLHGHQRWWVHRFVAADAS